MLKSEIGFVGLGNMGWSMAANLARKGRNLRVMDARPETGKRFRDEFGGGIAQGAADFQGCEILITMLPNGNIVREVLLGSEGKDSGIAAHLQPGTVIVDMSSADPAVYGFVAPVLEPLGIRIIDAPVSGNVSGAEAGTLTIMAGGAAEAIDCAEPVLLEMGKTVFRTGGLGSGQTMKALNNLASAGGLILSIEVLLIGKRAGLDPKQMNDILNVSTGRNNSTERKIAPFVLNGAYNSGFGLGLMAKDLRTAAAIAGRMDIDAPISTDCVDIATAAAEALPANADHTEIARWIQDRLGIEF